jgi:hypothetical protein
VLMPKLAKSHELTAVCKAASWVRERVLVVPTTVQKLQEKFWEMLPDIPAHQSPADSYAVLGDHTAHHWLGADLLIDTPVLDKHDLAWNWDWVNHAALTAVPRLPNGHKELRADARVKLLGEMPNIVAATRGEEEALARHKTAILAAPPAVFADPDVAARIAALTPPRTVRMCCVRLNWPWVTLLFVCCSPRR